jgi:hypothetical protein
MFQYSVTRDIAAPPDRVWAILSDARRLEDGFGITRIEGNLSPGATIKVFSEVSPGRAFPVRVTTFTAPARMVWTGGMPLGLFKGVRTFSLTPLPRTGTRFTMEEVFSGPFSGLIGRSMPDLQPSFETFATALKRNAET